MNRRDQKRRDRNRKQARDAKRWGSDHILPREFDFAEVELRTAAWLDQQNKRAE